MKRLIFCSLFLMLFASRAEATISTTRLLSPDSVTVSTLDTNFQTLTNAANSLDGTLIQGGTISADSLENSANPEVRWYHSFNSFVIEGLLPPTTSGTLTSTTTAGKALIKNDTTDKMKYVEKDATAKLYTATKWTYVDLSSEGTYTYSETVIGATEPSTTANSIRLARVSTDGTQVSNVRDDRVTSIQTSTNEDNLRNGFSCSRASTTTITVTPGVAYHGTTRVSKSANTTLTVSTATDWIDGVSLRAASTYGYIYIDTGGNIRMHTTAPAYNDSAGAVTVGKLRYALIGSTYYRCIGWFYMNATGGGELDIYGVGNFKDGDTFNTITRDSVTTATATAVTTGILTCDIVTSGNPVSFSYYASGIPNSDSVHILVLSIDSVAVPMSAVKEAESSGNGIINNLSNTFIYKPTAGEHKIELKAEVTTAHTWILDSYGLYINEN